MFGEYTDAAHGYLKWMFRRYVTYLTLGLCSNHLQPVFRSPAWAQNNRNHRNEGGCDVENRLSGGISEAVLREFVEEALDEVVRKCGSKWCLYSKHKKNGKSKRLGTHPSKAAAFRQERATKAHGG